MRDKPDMTIDDLYWCNNLNIFREIIDMETMETRGFKAYCSKRGKDIDDSFCHHCFLH